MYIYIYIYIYIYCSFEPSPTIVKRMALISLPPCISYGRLPHLSIPSKTPAWVPEFAVEDPPLNRIAALVPKFAMKDLPLEQNTLMMISILGASTSEVICARNE